MATVRCPICGTINPNGRRRLARCRRCRELLGKCRYCDHYDARLLDCTHVSHRLDEKIVDPDAVLTCLDFESSLVAERKRRPAPRLVRTAPLAALAAILAIFGFIHIYRGATLPPPPALLRASVSVPSVSFLESGFDVKVLVRNEAERPAQEVEVYITGRSLRRLTCQYIQPPEAFLESSANSVRTLVGDLQPGEIRWVLFHFMAARAGELDLTAHVTAANVPTPQKLQISGEVLP